jgi:hypothetical protein
MWEREPNCADVPKSGMLRVYELTCFGDMRRCVAKIEKRMYVYMVENESCSTTNHAEQNGKHIMLTPIEQQSKSTPEIIFLRAIIHHCTASMEMNPRKAFSGGGRSVREVVVRLIENLPLLAVHITGRPRFFEYPVRSHEWIFPTSQSFQRRAIPSESHPCLARDLCMQTLLYHLQQTCIAPSASTPI